MMRGWQRTALVVAGVVAMGSTAFAQNEPAVEPLAVPPPAPAGAPAYPPTYYPPPQPYGAYPPGPARLRYEEGDPIPAGYHVVHRARNGLVIGGTVLFAVSYGISLSVAMIDDFKHETKWLAIPVAGPWLMMYERSRPTCDSQTGSGCVEESLETILRFYLAVDGVAQAAGVTMLSFGISGRDILVRDDRYAAVHVHVMPGPVGSSGYGAMFSGLF
jgi:hypothetical protein